MTLGSIDFFVFAGIAGCCAKSAVAPFDRVKILLQAHNQHYKHLGEQSFSKLVENADSGDLRIVSVCQCPSNFLVFNRCVWDGVPGDQN